MFPGFPSYNRAYAPHNKRKFGICGSSEYLLNFDKNFEVKRTVAACKEVKEVELYLFVHRNEQNSIRLRKEGEGKRISFRVQVKQEDLYSCYFNDLVIKIPSF